MYTLINIKKFFFYKKKNFFCNYYKFFSDSKSSYFYIFFKISRIDYNLKKFYLSFDNKYCVTKRTVWLSKCLKTLPNRLVDSFNKTHFFSKYKSFFYLSHKNTQFNIYYNIVLYYLNSKKLNSLSRIHSNILTKTKKTVHKYNKKVFNYKQVYKIVNRYCTESTNNNKNINYVLDTIIHNNVFVNNKDFLFIQNIPNGMYLRKRLSVSQLSNNVLSIINTSSTHTFFSFWIYKKYITKYLNKHIFIMKTIIYKLLKTLKIFKLNISNDFYIYLNSLLSSIIGNTFTKLISKVNNLYLFFQQYWKNKSLFYTLQDYIIVSIYKSSKSYSSYYLRYYLLNFWYFFFFIEKTLTNYTNNNCFLFFTYNYTNTYYLNSAKLWCQYISYKLKKQISIRKIFVFIRKQQEKELHELKEHKLKLMKRNYNLNSLLNIKYPLKGIRILYSGNLKKAKRKQRISYYIWLSDNILSGKMPLNVYRFYIDYYSTHTTLRRSTIGLKMWLLLDLDQLFQ